MKNLLIIATVTLISFNSLQAATYNCSPIASIEYTKDGLKIAAKSENDKPFILSLDASTESVSDSYSTYHQGLTDCKTWGTGVDYSSGNGPDAFGFKIPANAFNGSLKSFNMGSNYDEDNDGEACSGAIYHCTL